MFSIRLGVPEIELRWKDLFDKAAAGRIGAEEKGLHKKWGKAMALLASDPRHPGLNSHEIGPPIRRKSLAVLLGESQPESFSDVMGIWSRQE